MLGLDVKFDIHQIACEYEICVPQVSLLHSTSLSRELTLLVCVYLGSTLEQMIHRRKHFRLLKLCVVDL